MILRGKTLDLRADELRRRRIQRCRGLIQQEQLRLVEQRLGQSRPSLFARRQQPALGMPQTPRGPNSRSNLLHAGAATRLDAVQEPEKPQILDDLVKLPGKAAWTDRREGACAPMPERGGFEISGCRRISTLPAVAAKNPQHHIDGSGFAERQFDPNRPRISLSDSR